MLQKKTRLEEDDGEEVVGGGNLGAGGRLVEGVPTSRHNQHLRQDIPIITGAFQMHKSNKLAMVL